jgi:hypothetical protein
LQSYQKKSLDFLDILAIVSFILQLQNNQELQKQSSNDDIMQELNMQDNKFFQTIISQNNQIIELNKKILEKLEGGNK